LAKKDAHNLPPVPLSVVILSPSVRRGSDDFTTLIRSPGGGSNE